MNRRSLMERAALVTTLGLGTGFVRPAALLAHTATPPASPASLDLPELVIEVDDAGFSLPGSAVSGPVLMVVRNTGRKPLHFFAIRVPDDVTEEELAAEPENDEDPAWFDMATLPMLGNPDWPAPGAEARGIVELGAGRWVFIDPLEGRDVTVLTVEAGPERDFTPPAADVSVGLIEMDFTGLDEPVPAGKSLWRIANEGAMIHELALLPVAEGTTSDEMIAALADMLQGKGDPDLFSPVGGQGIAAVGVTSWQWLDLAPGTYAAVCMSPMLGGDEAFMPHALMGMVRIFTVA